MCTVEKTFRAVVVPTIDSCSCAILRRHSEAGSAGGVDEILAAHFQAAMNNVFFFPVFPISG